jgi:Ca2+-binding RTX toxin-like protein
VLNGAAGADTMTGGAGNDTYVVDNAGDKAVEGAAGGSDTVQSSITFTLQTEVERLTLTGTSAINGSGNSLANTITGNAASNVLNGASGADSMTGGAGNDTYVVDNAGDKTIEAAAGGSDTVQSSVTFTLQAEVEKLTLTGSAATSGTGNTVGNTLIGNASANTLDGKAGADTLTGGAGADIFALTSSLGSDLVTDFTSGADKLRLSQAAIRIGDGDTIIEGASAVTGPNGFGSTAELVVVTHNIAGSITAASAATAVGHANNAYHAGDTRLFVVDNGSDSAVYLFKSANADSVVSANELSLLITLDNTASTAVTDYLFGT